MMLRSLVLTLSLYLLACHSANLAAAEFRSIDGSGNNIDNPTWGQAETELIRLASHAYEDGIDTPRGMTDLNNPPRVGTSRLPNPRDISNTVVAQGNRSIPNVLGASDWLWQWGQFIDHDLALEEPRPTSAPLLIPVTDPNDMLFDEDFPFLPFRRNDPAPGTGAGTGVPREQVNALTAYIDGSNVYGSDEPRAEFLRTGEGGLLKTSVGANGETLLPFNRAVDPFPNANPPVTPGAETPPAEALFIAGDVRANEQIGLTAIHTLFVREHNRIATELAGRADLEDRISSAGFDPQHAEEVDQFLYQMSRKVVGAQIQAITYNEFLPLLIGPNALPSYAGYDETVDATLANEFANAAYRVGHTLLSPEIQLADNENGRVGSVPLDKAFFDPQFTQENGIELVLKGLTTQAAQQVDAFVIDGVRNFLFAEGNGGLDLAAVNIQRGRDHGLPSYNDMRRALGLVAAGNFNEITSDAQLAAAFAQAYDSVEDVDLWIGALAEDTLDEGLVGELLGAILTDQFTRTRDGDRFFYLNDPHLMDLMPSIGDTRLSQVILRNTDIRRLAASAFLAVPEPGAALLGLLAMVSLMSPMSHRRRAPTQLRESNEQRRH